MSGKKDCPLCGTSLPIEATECSTCGEMFETTPPSTIAPEQPAEVECPSCMSLVPSGLGECPICGDKLPSSAPPVPTIEQADAIFEVAVQDATPAEAPSTPAAKECPECGTVSEIDAIECPVCGFKYEYEELSLPIQQAPAEPAPMAFTPPPAMPAKEEKKTKSGPKKKEAPPKAKSAPKEEAVVKPVAETAPKATLPQDIPQSTIRCPACGESVKSGSEQCQLCGVTISDYVIKCPGCGATVPAIDEVCPECFTTLREPDAPMGKTIQPPTVQAVMDIDVSGTIAGEIQDASEGRECLVCGALLEETSENCPVCRQPFGTTLPPEEEADQHWEGIGIEIPKDYYKCPNCEAVLSNTEPTDCEAAERKWFYRAIIALFSGIFISSASIWVRGVTLENEAQGLSPLPMDAVVNIAGWIFVVIGAIFWVFSWRAAESAKMCPSCGCEVAKNSTECPECGECFDLLEVQGLEGAEPNMEAGDNEEVA
ncbi:MAG: zinc ribbon domain-containing protein [Methanobacteriota archaeon]